MEVCSHCCRALTERGSVLLTSNLAFSKWDQIFKDAMTTRSGIDRLVHHSVHYRVERSSYPRGEAKQAERWESTTKSTQKD